MIILKIQINHSMPQKSNKMIQYLIRSKEGYLYYINSKAFTSKDENIKNFERILTAAKRTNLR